MSESSRLVECQDCGNRWDSTASRPRCSKAECGRSRNVEPVADDPAGDDAGDVEPEELEAELEEDRPDPGDEEKADRKSGEDPGDGDDASYSPGFEVRDVRTQDDTERAAPEAPTSDEAADDDEGEDEGFSGDPEDIPEIDPEQLEPGFRITFRQLARRRGEHWHLEDADARDADKGEAEELAAAWAPVINHYAPHIFREYTELGMALVVTVSVVGPRYMTDRQLEELAEKRAEDDEATDGAVEPETVDTEPERDPDAVADAAEPDEEELAGAFAKV